MTALTDAAAWLERWDHQQTGYIPDREEIFALMLDVVERLGGTPERVLDLACGPGSIAGRARNRWPDAAITGADLDPVLLELARLTLGDSVRLAEADLRDPGWETSAAPEPVDAVLSATALHWLSPDELTATLAGVGRILKPGGVFLDYDTMPLDAEAPRLRKLAGDLSETATSFTGGREDWDTWWTALRQEPALAELHAERERRFADRSRSGAPSRRTYEDALRKAGFQEVAVLHQAADRTLLAAIR